MRSTASSSVGFTTSPALRLALRLTAPLIVLVALTGSAAAQEPSDTRTAPPSAEAPPPPPPASAPVNVAKLPINLSRLQRQLRASADRTLQDGTNLKVFVDVYAFAPPLTLFTREDILGNGGAVPGAAPTHQDIVDQNTPEEHRGSNVVRKGGIKIFGGNKK